MLHYGSLSTKLNMCCYITNIIHNERKSVKIRIMHFLLVYIRNYTFNLADNSSMNIVGYQTLKTLCSPDPDPGCKILKG
jgi:hypothetical protein